MSRTRETYRHRRAWYPTTPPYGYEDLPGRIDAVETTVHDGLLTTITVTSTGNGARRALTWRYDHPRDRTANAILRDPATMPCEIDWRAAHALHDSFEPANALIQAHPGICSTCHPDKHAALIKKYPPDDT